MPSRPGSSAAFLSANDDFASPTWSVGIPVDRDRSFRFVVTGDSGLSSAPWVSSPIEATTILTQGLSCLVFGSASQAKQRHPEEYIVMVMDQAGWHVAQELEVPGNMRLVLLPPYSPEINPAEHIWDALRENCIGNTVFASPEAADKALSKGLRSLESDHEKMQSLTGFNWITSISLNAK